MSATSVPFVPPVPFLRFVVLTVATKRGVKTIAQAVLAIAILAGFATYRTAPAPGVKTLWIGSRKLADMTAGYLLAKYQDRLET